MHRRKLRTAAKKFQQNKAQHILDTWTWMKMMMSHNFRQTALTDRATLYFENKGTVLQNAILTHDFDNDNELEFIMGSVYGSLVIFKNKNLEPVYRCDHLGTITCIVSSTFNSISYLIVVCAEGECHLFQSIVQASSTSPSSSSLSPASPSSSYNENDNMSDSGSGGAAVPVVVERQLSPLFTNRVPCNITCALMVDYDLDGEQELVLGSNDRNAYIYKIHIKEQTISLLCKVSMDDNQVYSLSKHTRHRVNHSDNDVSGAKDRIDPETEREDILIGFAGGGYAYIDCAASTPDHCHIQFFKALNNTASNNRKRNPMAATNASRYRSPNMGSGTNASNMNQMRSQQQRELCQQDEAQKRHESSSSSSFSSITSPLHGSSDVSSGSELLVFSKLSTVISKPLIVLGNVPWFTNSEHNQRPSSPSDDDDGDVETRRHQESTREEKSNTFAAFATVDGKIRVHCPSDGFDSKNWSIDLHQEIVSLYQAPFVSLSSDHSSNSKSMTCTRKAMMTTTTQLCATTWDGITYVIDQDKNVVCFNLQERISTTYVGHYSLNARQPPVLCLFFVTFTDKIYVYYNVEVTSVAPLDLKYALQSDTDPELQSLLRQVCPNQRNIVDMNDVECTKLLHAVLYDFDEAQLKMLSQYCANNNQ